MLNGLYLLEEYTMLSYFFIMCLFKYTICYWACNLNFKLVDNLLFYLYAVF